MNRSANWKKNFSKIPHHIVQKIEKLPTHSFVVAATLTVNEDKRQSYDHLKLPLQEGGKSTVQPPSTSGRYSKRNVEGWEIKRTDLPKITKVFSWESPNFGDGARNGYHTHFQDREVYQREYREPLFLTISSYLLKRGQGGSVYQVRVDHVFDRTASAVQETLFFAINLLQENCGVVDVQGADASPEDLITTQPLDWKIFPPGSSEEVTRAILHGARHSLEAKEVKQRVELFNSLKPKSFLRGQGGFGAYVGALFDDDLVVFENIQYGNALYIIYEDWVEVSKRSRLELIRGTDAKFDRIVHKGEWQELFKRLIRSRLRNKRR